MADVSQEPDVKETPVAESSPETNPDVVATPPAGEHPAAKPQGAVPYPRFNEVIQERNREREMREQYEARIRELEAQKSGQGANAALDRLTARLRDELQMDEGAARKLAAIQLEASEQAAASKTQHLQAQARRQEIEMWSNSLASKYGDYQAVAPAMEKVFATLPPETQDLVVSSRAGLEMLYSYAKGSMSEAEKKAVFDKGVQHGAVNAGLKKAISSAPGMGAGGGKAPLSKESLAKMPDKEFLERKAEIDAWVAEQSRRR